MYFNPSCKDTFGVQLNDFNRLLFEKPENFELYNPNLDVSLDLSKNVKINEHNNLYYILQKNTITNGLFTNFIANKATIVAINPKRGISDPISKPSTIVAPTKPSKTPIHCLKETFSPNIGPLNALVSIG